MVLKIFNSYNKLKIYKKDIRINNMPNYNNLLFAFET